MMNIAAAWKHPRQWPWKWIIPGLAVLMMLPVLSHQIDWARVREGIDRLPAAWVIGLMATLPLGGFSIGIVYLIAGARFGTGWGAMIVGLAIGVHLAGSYFIARSWLKQPLEKWMKRKGHQLPQVPQGENVSLALLAALIPGVPYAARNYLLALSGIPFRVYLTVCWPIHFLRSLLAIYLGDFDGEFGPQKVFILLAIFCFKIGICVYLLHRVRSRVQARQVVDARASHG